MNFETLLNSIAAAGPMAAVLGFACLKLWNANQTERERHFTEEERERVLNLAELKAHREACAEEMKASREQYIRLVEKLTRALNDEESHHDRRTS